MLAIVLGAVVLFWYVFGVHIQSRQAPARLAFWMEHSWSTGLDSSQSGNYNLLVEQVDIYGITDLYFHVGPIEEGGTLADDLAIFTPGLEALGTTNYAWIGQVRSQIDLSTQTVRQQIIESSEWLIDQGFDGIHIDIEPVRPGDADFMLLLEEMDAAGLPKISIAIDEWQPHFLSQLLAWHIDQSIESYWTKDQIKEAAIYADQIVVMTYDTNFNEPRLYTWWVEQQTIALSRFLSAADAAVASAAADAAGNAAEPTELFIGLPSYDEGASINPAAENLQSGLAGFRLGVQNLRSKSGAITGVAIYPYWEMDDSEWATLQTNL